MKDEWQRHQIILPQDEWDEDDEEDLRIAKAEKKKREHITRGVGLQI